MFSVLMSVYSKEKPEYLEASVSSIWFHQTRKPDQIVVVKDGPLTQELEDVLEKWKLELGDVLLIVGTEVNMGLAAALNLGLRYCKYDLVARMDSDDLSMPMRFEEQVLFMEKNPEISVFGGAVEEWDASLEIRTAVRTVPVTDEQLKNYVKFRCPVSHPSVMFRKSDILSVGGYPDIYPEDYALWVEMINSGFKFGNATSVFVRMRTGDDFLKRRGWRFFKGEVFIIRKMYGYNMIKATEFLACIFLRGFLRLCPVFIKEKIYRFFR
ncbi:glycosyl transferase [Halomonas litopenaei]|uniref:Glycosyl transferase n=1 Tax=Halomonas litopenaei TaxID=2109328 RepID=A0ABX5IR15_9GAMM|nr:MULTISPECIES: glycosyltransferase [Halomonas]PTL88561.1 glycosyl transferase [Halomonas sp. SYSU XM8]PTL88609.1 glycosyl transferase [Halomonas litopenaei]